MPGGHSKLFRKAALDRLASPDQLDQFVGSMDIRGWVAAAGLAVGLVLLLAWGILGRVPMDVPAKGLLIVQDGRIMAATSPASGRVEAVRVRPGDTVRRGDTIATLRQEEEERRLANAREVVAEQRLRLKRRRTALDDERVLKEANAERRRAAILQAIAAAEQRVAFLTRQEAGRADLLAQGYSSAQALEEVRTELNAAHLKVTENRSRLPEIDAELADAEMARVRELDRLEADLADARRRVTELEAAIAETQTVRAPSGGRVTEVAVTPGAMVAPGAPLATIETAGTGLQAVVYIPTEHGKRVAPGMVARIVPDSVRKEESGAMIGEVVAVSDFPASAAGMASVLQNDALIEALSGEGGPPYEARVNLRPADTPTGYAWTSGDGPAIRLTSGTTVKAELTVREDPPINLIMPLIRRATGATP